MSRSVRLWVRVSAEAAAAAALLLFAGIPAPEPLLDWPLALGVGGLVGAAMLGVLARRPPPAPRVRRGRARVVLGKAAVVSVGSTSEEVVWRWLALGGLSPLVGVGPAFAASTLGFAVAHGRTRAMLVHLLTGAGFGAVFLLTGSLAAAVAAHVSYNLLVLLAGESERSAVLPARTLVRGLRDPPSPALRLHEVEKSFGSTQALRRVSLEVGGGEVLALLGPNGAGKSTALAVALGLRRPDRGEARLFGRDPREPKARREIGATPQETGFPGTLRVREIIELARAHYPAPASVSELVDRFGLAKLDRRQAGGLSGGERRRLGVALAFAGNPRAVFLDEPTTGLDVESRRGVWDAIRAYAGEGGSVLLTTHYLDEAEALASRIAVLAGGRIVSDGSVAEIKAAADLRTVRLKAEALPHLPGAERVVREGSAWTIATRDVDTVIRSLVRADIPLHDLEVLPASLEEVFLDLTRAP